MASFINNILNLKFYKLFKQCIWALFFFIRLNLSTLSTKIVHIRILKVHSMRLWLLTMFAFMSVNLVAVFLCMFSFPTILNLIFNLVFKWIISLQRHSNLSYNQQTLIMFCAEMIIFYAGFGWWLLCVVSFV